MQYPDLELVRLKVSPSGTEQVLWDIVPEFADANSYTLLHCPDTHGRHHAEYGDEDADDEFDRALRVRVLMCPLRV